MSGFFYAANIYALFMQFIEYLDKAGFASKFFSGEVTHKLLVLM